MQPAASALIPAEENSATSQLNLAVAIILLLSYIYSCALN
jgi:hypothetical protein